MISKFFSFKILFCFFHLVFTVLNHINNETTLPSNDIMDTSKFVQRILDSEPYEFDEEQETNYQSGLIIADDSVRNSEKSIAELHKQVYDLDANLNSSLKAMANIADNVIRKFKNPNNDRII